MSTLFSLDFALLPLMHSTIDVDHDVDVDIHATH